MCNFIIFINLSESDTSHTRIKYLKCVAILNGDTDKMQNDFLLKGFKDHQEVTERAVTEAKKKATEWIKLLEENQEEI